MADTRRTWAALAALYADNTAGAISPQDLRDGFKSLQPHVTSSAPDENDDETSGFDTDHAWIDTSTTPNSLYRCLDASTGAAVWAKVYPAEAASVGAEDVAFDNSTSGLTAEDVQAAIDEVVGGLGTAAAADAADFATAAQGSKADTAVQPGDALTDLSSGAATAGHVPTANGSGGITWAAQTGGGGGGIAPADGLVVVQHGAVASTARPTAAVALWRGSAEPENAVDGDMWDDDESWDA